MPPPIERQMATGESPRVCSRAVGRDSDRAEPETAAVAPGPWRTSRRWSRTRRVPLSPDSRSGCSPAPSTRSTRPDRHQARRNAQSAEPECPSCRSSGWPRTITISPRSTTSISWIKRASCSAFPMTTARPRHGCRSEDLRFSAEIEACVDALDEMTPPSEFKPEVLSMLKEAYRPGRTFARGVLHLDDASLHEPTAW